MLSFLSWNLNKKPLEDRVARIVKAHDVDVIMLAECATALTDLLAALNAVGDGDYRVPFSTSTKIVIATRLSEDDLADSFNDESGGLTIRRLATQLGPVLLAVVHFPSRASWGPDSQTQEAMELADDIREAEGEAGHRRTILVGDLNMNPFDPGVVGARGLHAMMTRQLVEKGERVIRRRSYPFFYNPMWGHFGDRTPGPPGTYFRIAAEHHNPFWHMYDQVLLRPELSNRLDRLMILDTDGYDQLVTDLGRPRADSVSDHLPIVFRLAL